MDLDRPLGPLEVRIRPHRYRRGKVLRGAGALDRAHEPPRVHAVRGDFAEVVAREVGRGKADGAPALESVDDLAADPVAAPEDPGGPRHVACGEKLTHPRRGPPAALRRGEIGHERHLDAFFLSQFGQHSAVAFVAAPEPDVLADDDDARPQLAHKLIFEELAGRRPGVAEGVPLDVDGVDPRSGEAIDPVAQGRNEMDALARMHGGGMRIECERHGDEAAFLRLPDRLTQHRAVAFVHAVEDPYRHRRADEAARNVLRSAPYVDAHAGNPRRPRSRRPSERSTIRSSTTGFSPEPPPQPQDPPPPQPHPPCPPQPHSDVGSAGAGGSAVCPRTIAAATTAASTAPPPHPQ